MVEYLTLSINDVFIRRFPLFRMLLVKYAYACIYLFIHSTKLKCLPAFQFFIYTFFSPSGVQLFFYRTRCYVEISRAPGGCKRYMSATLGGGGGGGQLGVQHPATKCYSSYPIFRPTSIDAGWCTRPFFYFFFRMLNKIQKAEKKRLGGGGAEYIPIFNGICIDVSNKSQRFCCSPLNLFRFYETLQPHSNVSSAEARANVLCATQS